MIHEKQPGLSAERPFIGLMPFGFADHDYFFGREDQVYSLFRLLDRGRFIAVVGSSGSGKSSLVRAGLLPILEQESTGLGGRQWRWIEMRPGDTPLNNLARELALLGREDGPDEEAMTAVREGRIGAMLRRSSLGLGKALSEFRTLEGQSVLLVVDQFEELFRFAHAGSDARDTVRWREEAAQFVQTLLEATRERAVAIHVLITMRSDFIGDCAQFYGLPEAVSATQFLVPSTTRDQREQIITAPVAKAGAGIDPLLVEQLLNDVSDELDQLPVLQHCLMRLWEAARRDAPSTPPFLGMAHYDSIGRAQGALSQHAEEIFHGQGDKQIAVEQIFRAIAETDGDGRLIRRAIPFARLVAETGIDEKSLREVCDRFRADDCSFVVPSLSSVPYLQPETPVDVGHEALLRRWNRIGARAGELVEGSEEGGWLVEEERDGRRYRALLALVEGRRGKGRVTLPVDQVAEWREWWTARPRTRAWAERYGGNFARVQQLLADSETAWNEEHARAAWQSRRDRGLRIATAFAAMLILGLCVTAFSEWIKAGKAEQHAIAEQIEAEHESHMMLDQITSNLYTTFENFRLVPHAEKPVQGILVAAGNFAKAYEKWNNQTGHGSEDSSYKRLDAALAIAIANMNLIYGNATLAVKNMDTLEKQKISAIPASDPAGLLLHAEFHFHRATAERYNDLFERARYDYTEAARLAQAVIHQAPTAGQAENLDTLQTEADALWRRALRVRVEVDTAAHQISDSPRDLDRAIADNREYSATFDVPGPSAAGGDLSNIGARKDEKVIHDALVDLERSRFADAAAVYKRYLATITAAKIPEHDLLSAVVLAGGRQGYARALFGLGDLQGAQQQIDLADTYYEEQLLPTERNNPFGMHADDQVHWVAGYIAMARHDLPRARREFSAMLKSSNYLIGLDQDNAREWGDLYKAHTGLAALAEISHDQAARKSEQDAAVAAKAKADDIRRRSVASRPAAEREAIAHQ